MIDYPGVLRALTEARRRGYRSVGLARLIAVAEAATATAAGQNEKAIGILAAVQQKHGEDPKIAAQIASLRKK